MVESAVAHERAPIVERRADARSGATIRAMARWLYGGVPLLAGVLVLAIDRSHGVGFWLVVVGAYWLWRPDWIAGRLRRWQEGAARRAESRGESLGCAVYAGAFLVYAGLFFVALYAVVRFVRWAWG